MQRDMEKRRAMIGHPRKQIAEASMHFGESSLNLTCSTVAYSWGKEECPRESFREEKQPNGDSSVKKHSNWP